MGGTRPLDGPSWFTRHSGAALFSMGGAMVFIGLLGLEGTSAVTSAFLGCGLMLVGALLPRLTGTIKVTPGSIELALAERLEATRREVEARAPELEEQALTRAVEELLPSVLEQVRATAPTDVPAGTAHQRRTPGRARWTWAAAGASATALTLVGVVALAQLRTDGPLAPTADDGLAPDGTVTEEPGGADGPGSDDLDEGSASDDEVAGGEGAVGDGRLPDDEGVAGGEDGELPREEGVTGDQDAPADEVADEDTDAGTGGDEGAVPGQPLADDPAALVVLWAVVLLAAALLGTLMVQRRRHARPGGPTARTATALSAEPAPAFASRIVDELVGGAAPVAHDGPTPDDDAAPAERAGPPPENDAAPAERAGPPPENDATR